MKSLTQPIKWHGGKYYLRSWIISHMPPHLHYVEPYFGAGGVLLGRDPERNWIASDPSVKVPSGQTGCSEVVNDVHGELQNFWRVLQSTEHFAEFQRRVALIPFSQVEFEQASNDNAEADVVSRAVRFFVVARQSRQGLMKDFATMSRNRTQSGMNEQVSAWLSVIDGLPDVHERLRRVVILNRDALEVIRIQDGPLTLFYCDPPYMHETRSSTGEYQHEMTAEQHEDLLETLAGIEGKFMLSGYRSEIYDQWCAVENWTRHEYEIDNKAASGKVKEKRVECLWCNF